MTPQAKRKGREGPHPYEGAPGPYQVTSRR